MPTKKHPTIYAFIDSQNLNLGTLSQGWKLDFGKFRQFLTDKYHVDKAFLFIGHIAGNESLYEYLASSGYICIYKPTLEHKSGKKVVIKGNVDAELVLHSMIEYKHYQKAIIISGDGDFRCLVEYLAARDKLAKIIIPNHQYSSLLRPFAQYIVNINLFKAKIKK